MRFSRWQTIGILGVTAFICLAAAPNFLPARAFERLPAWAQRKVALGSDAAGGTHVVLAVARDGKRGAIPWRRDASMRGIEARAELAGVKATVRAVGADRIVVDSADPALLEQLSQVHF